MSEDIPTNQSNAPREAERKPDNEHVPKEDDYIIISDDDDEDVQLVGSNDKIQLETKERLMTLYSELEFDKYVLPYRSYAYEMSGRDPKDIMIHARDVLKAARVGERSEDYESLHTIFKFFKQLGHPCVRVFIGQTNLPSDDFPAKTPFFHYLNVSGGIHIIPDSFSRTVVTEQRYLLEYAAMSGSVIITNEIFKPYNSEGKDYNKVIIQQILTYCFIDGIFMLPTDPNGRNGPSLLQLLSDPHIDVEGNEK